VPEPTGASSLITYQNSISITLSSLVYGAKIFYTTDGSLPTASSKLYSSPFKVDFSSSPTVDVRAICVTANGKQSIPCSAVYSHNTFTPLKLDVATNGLNAYIILGKQIDAASLDSNVTHLNCFTPEIGLCDNVPDENFGYIQSGYLKIPADGTYTFSLSSDDGSVMYIDGQLLIENDGYHETQTVNGSIELKAGYHPIILKYVQGSGDKVLQLKFKTATTSFQDVPQSWLFR